MQDINYNPSDAKPCIICMPYKTDELLVQLVGPTVPVINDKLKDLIRTSKFKLSFRGLLAI